MVGIPRIDEALEPSHVDNRIQRRLKVSPITTEDLFWHPNLTMRLPPPPNSR